MKYFTKKNIYDIIYDVENSNEIEEIESISSISRNINTILIDYFNK